MSDRLSPEKDAVGEVPGGAVPFVGGADSVLMVPERLSPVNEAVGEEVPGATVPFVVARDSVPMVPERLSPEKEAVRDDDDGIDPEGAEPGGE